MLAAPGGRRPSISMVSRAVLLRIGLAALLLGYAAVWLSGCAPLSREQFDPLDILWPYRQVDKFSTAGFREPSGLVFHPARGTLFVVGDEGDIAEAQPDGRLVKTGQVSKQDFEGITADPASGLLYLIEESRARIWEVNPEDFSIGREFAIEPMLDDRTILSREDNRVEGITFVPDASQAEGGTFYLANASLKSQGASQSVLFEVEVPLKSGSGQNPTARIIRDFTLAVPDISDLSYNPRSGYLYVISDETNTIFEVTKEGRVLQSYALPGDNQEGLAVDSRGFLYIAQDSGGILKFEPNRVKSEP